LGRLNFKTPARFLGPWLPKIRKIGGVSREIFQASKINSKKNQK